MLRRAAATIGRPPSHLALRYLSTPIPSSSSSSPVPAQHHSATLVEDPSVAFKDKSDLEIARAWLVFRLCAIKPVVDNAPQLLKLSRRLLGDALTFDVIVRHTFFEHFCGGTSGPSIQNTVERLQRQNVGAILDYAAEADVDPTPKQGIISARSYEYEDEQKCELNKDISMKAIEEASQQKQGFAAVKMSSLGKPELLEHVSTCLHAVRRLFRSFSGRNGQPRPNDFYIKSIISHAEFKRELMKMSAQVSSADAEALCLAIDKQNNGIDYLEWLETLDPTSTDSHALFLLAKLLSKDQQLPSLSAQELQEMKNLYRRLNELAVFAQHKRVRLMVDAEQTYLQPAIDHCVHRLQRTMNKEFPTIYNTFQCYLTDTPSRIALDLERARQGGYIWAAKMVRGAYMVQERKRAGDLGYKDPICASKEDTDRQYNQLIETLMQAQASQRVSFMIASHNAQSVQLATQGMRAVGLPSDSSSIAFGQLLGMKDVITLGLAKRGFNVHKYVPYGPIKEVIPYLVRRAQENSGFMGDNVELQLLTQELKTRIKNFAGDFTYKQ